MTVQEVCEILTHGNPTVDETRKLLANALAILAKCKVHAPEEIAEAGEVVQGKAAAEILTSGKSTVDETRKLLADANKRLAEYKDADLEKATAAEKARVKIDKK